MQVSLSGMTRSAIVAFSEYGYRVAMNRFGTHDVVVRWPEFQALAAGVEKGATPEEQHTRLKQGVRFFEQRQRLPPC